MKTFLQRAWPYFLVLGLMPFFYTNRFLHRGVNVGEDVLQYDVPHAIFFVRSIHEGFFPLWNPHLVCGIPAAEAPFMGPFYPLFILYFLLPVGWAITIGFLFHIALSGLCFVWLCRLLGLSRFAAFFAASGWAFSSLFQQYSESGWLGEAVATAYLPCALCFLIRSREAQGPSECLLLLLAGFSCALAIAGGHMSYSFIVIACVLLFYLPLVRRPREIVSLAVLLLFVLLLTLAVWGPIAVQSSLSPTPRFKMETYRLRDLLNLVDPIGIRGAFVGRLALVLGLLGLAVVRSPFGHSLRSVFLVTILLCLLPSWGPLAGIAPLVVRYAWTWHIGVVFSLLILSGMALDRFKSFLERRGLSGSKVRVLVLVLTAIQIADLYGFNRRFYPRGFDTSFAAYYAPRAVLETVREDKGLFRVLNADYESSVLHVNEGLVHGIDCVNAKVKGANLCSILGQEYINADVKYRTRWDVRDLSNVKYVLVEARLLFAREGFENLNFRVAAVSAPMEKDDEGYERAFVLLENPTAFPRAFAVRIPADGELPPALLSTQSVPFADATIDAETMAVLRNYRDVTVWREGNEYRIQSDIPERTFLFMSEMYSPGWTAKIDGALARVDKPFDAFMGVYVPAGEHEIVFAYRPWRTILFFTMSLLTLVLSLGLGVYLWKCVRRGVSPARRLGGLLGQAPAHSQRRRNPTRRRAG
ncbi:YfhO family protein [Candidatus Sumerlaeota bacterium]|nr:YfhO family protein [Candidatus Sumerlaeota bacterium]